MSYEQIRRDDCSYLVAGAAQVAARVRYCWLVIEATAARPMGRILSDASGQDSDPAAHDWTIRFVTDLRSRKVAEIHSARTVQLIFQDDANEAFVVLGGGARVLSDAAIIRQWWRQAYERYFPTEEDRRNAAFIEVRVQRMRLWIRGVTPEPFGVHPVELERDDAGKWRLTG